MKYQRQSTAYTGDQNPNWKGNELEHTCLECGCTFRRGKTNKEHTYKYCSQACYQAVIKRNAQPKKETIPLAEMRGAKHPRYAGDRFCKTCGAQLIGRNLRRRGYCSTECGKVAARAGLEKMLEARRVQGQFYCQQCNAEILGKGRYKRKFCSRACMGKWQSEHNSAKNSPILKPDLSRLYPPEFNQTLRRQIRKRDNYTCQVCGLKTKFLDVHHIDEDKSNSDPSNLISLCKPCHMRHHALKRGAHNAKP